MTPDVQTRAKAPLTPLSSHVHAYPDGRSVEVSDHGVLRMYVFRDKGGRVVDRTFDPPVEAPRRTPVQEKRFLSMNALAELYASHDEEAAGVRRFSYLPGCRQELSRALAHTARQLAHYDLWC